MTIEPSRNGAVTAVEMATCRQVCNSIQIADAVLNSATSGVTRRTSSIRASRGMASSASPNPMVARVKR